MARRRPRRRGRGRPHGSSSSAGWSLLAVLVGVVCFFLGYRWAYGSSEVAGAAQQLAPLSVDPVAFYSALSTLSMMVGIVSGILGAFVSWKLLEIWSSYAARPSQPQAK